MPKKTLELRGSQSIQKTFVMHFNRALTQDEHDYFLTKMTDAYLHCPLQFSPTPKLPPAKIIKFKPKRDA